jgi:hypothetical protein
VGVRSREFAIDMVEASAQPVSAVKVRRFLLRGVMIAETLCSRAFQRVLLFA